MLYLAPLVIMLSGVAFWEIRAGLEGRADSAAYNAAASAMTDGRLLDAERLFVRAGDYGDAPAKLADVRNDLAHFQSSYNDGVAALATGDYDAAMALLLPVARAIPG